MPDLTVESYWCCQTCIEWKQTVVGSKGARYSVKWSRFHKNNHKYEYDYSCSCMGYRMRPGDCKHIEQVRASKARCGWDQWQDGGEPAEKDGHRVCPKCGGVLTAHKVAV